MNKETLRDAISQLDDNIIERGLQPISHVKRHISRSIITTVVAAELVIASVGLYAMTREKPDSPDVEDSPASSMEISSMKTNETLNECYNSSYFSWDDQTGRYTYIEDFGSPDFINMTLPGETISYLGVARPKYQELLFDLSPLLSESGFELHTLDVLSATFQEMYDKAHEAYPDEVDTVMAKIRKASIEDFEGCFVFAMKQDEAFVPAAIALEDILDLKGKLNRDVLISARYYYSAAERAVEALQDSLTPKQVEAMQKAFGYMVAPALQKCGKLNMLQTPDDITAEQLVEFANYFSPEHIGAIMEQSSYPLHDDDQICTRDIMNFERDFVKICYDIRLGKNPNPDFSVYVKNARLNEYLKAWADVQRTQMALDPSYDTFTDFGISVHWRKSNGFNYSHFADHGTEDGHEQMFSSLQMVCTTDDFHTVLVQIRLLSLNHSGDERAVINHFSMLLRKENSIVTILDFEDALFRPLATGNDTVTDILDKNYSCVRQNNEISLDSENYWNTETSEQELAEMRKYAAAVADQEPMHKKLHEYIAENFDMLWHTGLLELNKETNEMYYEDETNLTYNHLCIYDDPVGSYYYGEEPQERTVEHNFISSIFMTDKPSGSCVIQVTDTKDDDAYYVYMNFLDTNNHVYVLIRPDGDSFTCEPFIGSH